MLRFTPEQQAFVLNSRRAFNNSQAALASTHGFLAANALMGNALPMPKDVWGEWDTEGVEVQREVLSVFNDLASLARPMPIGKLVHFFQTISDSGSVNKSIDGRSKANADRPVFNYFGTPLPIIDSTFNYGWRMVEAARSEGISLDPAARANAMYKVAESIEVQTIRGDASIVVGASVLYGLANHPNRNTRATGVALVGATGAQWLTEINALTALLYGDLFFTPPTVYMNVNTWKYARETDYSTLYPGVTIAQRILQSGIANVVPSSKINANEMIAVIKDRRVVQVLNGMPMSTVPMFRANPQDDYNFATMAATAVEIKFDAAGRCGIAHSS